jgi:hypothetical protein
MTVTVKVLIDPLQAAAAETTLYTSPTTGAGGKGTIIDKFTGTNTTAAAVVLTVKLIKLGGVAGAANTIVAKSIPANDVYSFPEIVGHVLNPGDFISVLAASAAAVTVRSSGREIS